MSATNSLPTFDRLFPSFQDQCQSLFAIVLPIAVILLVGGLIAGVRHSSSPASLLMPIITTAALTLVLAFWGDWIDLAQRAMRSVITEMDADPIGTAQRYVDVLVSKEQPHQKSGWFGLPSAAQMYEAVVWGVLTLIGFVAHFLIWAAYLIQRFLLGLGYAFAPIFLGLFALRSTGGIAFRYVMGIVGLIAWPLGWAAASIGTSNLIDVATEQGLVVVSNVYGLQTIMAAAIIGGWVIVTTLIAPVIIQYAIASGAQVGSALLGGAFTAGTAALSAGATTAATVGTAGIGTAGVLAGASASTAGSLAGSMTQGGGPPPNGSMIGQLVRPWWWMPSTSAGDSSDRKSENSSEGPPSEPQPTSPAESASPSGNSPTTATSAANRPYNPRDPSNSEAIAKMIEATKRDQQS